MKLNLLKWMTVLMAILVAFAAIIGISHSGIYTGASLNWVTQTIVQDYFNLCVLVPVLIISGLLLPSSKYSIKVMWLGAMFYAFYTFIIYAFSVRFNMLFPAYCLVLGLCFYSLMIFFTHNNLKSDEIPYFRPWLQKASAVFLLLFGILFYALWLLEVGEAIAHNTIPNSLKEADLYTNPVHVLDLSIVLPAFAILGYKFLRHTLKAVYLAPAALFFSSLMSLTIATIMFGFYLKGLEDSYMLAIVFACISISNLLMVLFLPKATKRSRNMAIPVIFLF